MRIVPPHGAARRTFLLEALRSLPGGCVETLGLTFAVLIAVRVFDASSWQKASLVAAPSTGLLLSLFLVQIVRRTGWTVNATAAGIWVLSGLSLLGASLGGGNLSIYLIGVCLALVGITVGYPLISQIYQKHYPDTQRGRLFSFTGVVRKASALSFAALFGVFLRASLDGYVWLLAIYGLGCLAMAGTVLFMGKVHLEKTTRVKFFSAFEHVGRDREFRNLLVAWMILGFGNLLCWSLFVEYISNPKYGYTLDEFSIGFITGSIPEIMFLLFVVWWGHIFDRVNFFVVRAAINLLFVLGIFFYFIPHGIWALCVGIALHGLARAGGNIAWSLWVTKFAKGEHVAEYMSVHTFLCGIRGMIAPFIAFYVAALPWAGPRAVAITSMTLILIATAMLIPSMRFRAPRREGDVVEPDPRTS